MSASEVRVVWDKPDLKLHPAANSRPATRQSSKLRPLDPNVTLPKAREMTPCLVPQIAVMYWLVSKFDHIKAVRAVMKSDGFFCTARVRQNLMMKDLGMGRKRIQAALRHLEQQDRICLGQDMNSKGTEVFIGVYAHQLFAPVVTPQRMREWTEENLEKRRKANQDDSDIKKHLLFWQWKCTHP